MSTTTPRQSGLDRLRARIDRAGGPDAAPTLLLAETRVCARLVIEEAVTAALRAGSCTVDELARIPEVRDATTIPGVTLVDVLDNLIAVGAVPAGLISDDNGGTP